MTPASRPPPLLRLAAALVPLALCAGLGWGVMSGPLELGGGEKDVLLLLPLAVWALAFALGSLAMWARGATLARASLVAAVAGVGVLALAFAALVAVAYWSPVSARFEASDGGAGITP